MFHPLGIFLFFFFLSTWVQLSFPAQGWLWVTWDCIWLLPSRGEPDVDPIKGTAHKGSLRLDGEKALMRFAPEGALSLPRFVMGLARFHWLWGYFRWVKKGPVLGAQLHHWAGVSDPHDGHSGTLAAFCFILPSPPALTIPLQPRQPSSSWVLVVLYDINWEKPTCTGVTRSIHGRSYSFLLIQTCLTVLFLEEQSVSVSFSLPLPLVHSTAGQP